MNCIICEKPIAHGDGYFFEKFEPQPATADGKPQPARPTGEGACTHKGNCAHEYERVANPPQFVEIRSVPRLCKQLAEEEKAAKQPAEHQA